MLGGGRTGLSRPPAPPPMDPGQGLLAGAAGEGWLLALVSLGSHMEGARGTGLGWASTAVVLQPEGWKG